MRVILAASEDAPLGPAGKFTVELRPPSSRTLSSSLSLSIVERPPTKQTESKLNLPNIDCQPVEAVESEEWVSLGWPADVGEVAADYVYLPAQDTLQIRYSTLFPRYKAVLGEFASRDAARSNSFVTRYRIWLTTSVLIHWQDIQQDATKLGEANLDQDLLDDYRRDEIRRMSKASIIFAQREVRQGIQTADAEG